MKKCLNIGIILAIAALLIFTGGLFFEVVMAEEINKITVNGNGIVSVDPDEATINFSVETMKDTANEAQSETARITNEVIEKLKENGITEEQIKTRNIYTAPRYDYSPTGERKIIGYISVNDFEVETKDIDNVAKIIDIGIKAGATGIDGVTFSISDTNKYYGDALKMAIENATDNANTIASSIGVNLGKVINVTDNGSYNSYKMMADTSSSFNGIAKAEYEDAGAGYISDIRYDKIDIRAQVTMIFSY